MLDLFRDFKNLIEHKHEGTPAHNLKKTKKTYKLKGESLPKHSDVLQ